MKFDIFKHFTPKCKVMLSFVYNVWRYGITGMFSVRVYVTTSSIIPDCSIRVCMTAFFVMVYRSFQQAWSVRLTVHVYTSHMELYRNRNLGLLWLRLSCSKSCWFQFTQSDLEAFDCGSIILNTLIVVQQFDSCLVLYIVFWCSMTLSESQCVVSYGIWKKPEKASIFLRLLS